MEAIRSAEILCVGTELLLGDIINTNAAFMSQRLAEAGVSVYRQAVVGDNSERLRTALGEALSRADAVFLSGGLGPTSDDLTKETVAEYFGLPMHTDGAALESIVDYFRSTGREMPENNRKQAMIPEGAYVFYNKWGTAPALALEQGGKTVIMLPGPPVELCPLWEMYVAPYLAERSGAVIVSRNVHIIGMGESQVEQELREMMFSGQNPSVAPYCRAGEVRVRVSARARSPEQAGAMCDAAIEDIRKSAVSRYIYGIDVGSVENALLLRLRRRGETLAVAESCTGGLLGKRMTELAGCSDVFLGGCVTYANEAKEALLGVSPETLRTYGAVSAETAREMARGARERLGADVGISTTGIAGPGGGTPEKPVGTVYICVSDRDGERVERLSMSPLRSRDYIRESAASHAFALAMKGKDGGF